ncbi:TonB-dependent receptor [Bowmanella sp. JS7-9]|uniref:TonB-dependent receptor n=1 Tax=Pseudobowmanella zhangzhouensis TaxID=1537679 RepID=A0ABW1XJZ4_9ALTE|nr:TonB-dependent receptor [Bowmanella sp. JS7-9]TBX23190.1 TonB-dependent receptor [Bowmanella sp. JS7-9]
MRRVVVPFVISQLVSSLPVWAHGPTFEEISVYGHRTRMTGDALAASQGVIGQGEIDGRPMLRTGEMLELVPGMVVTQHSGSGKANQYFLRGFNLDHGTDFRTTVMGMPVNMRSHGHGQGYSDLNFIVPEFVGQISYNKGAYSALGGDFSTAGAADVFLLDRMDANLLKLELGQDDYLRSVAATTLNWQDSRMLTGVELTRYTGPWQDISEDIHKFNGLVNYSQDLTDGRIGVTLMAYDNQWHSADQIPQRLVDSGALNPLGSLDDTLGGDASRYSLSVNAQLGRWTLNAYALHSDLQLFSNFTYFLNDPINGDQFEQTDKRNIYGAELSKHWSSLAIGLDWQQQAGLVWQAEDIGEVGLFNTRARTRLSTVRRDKIDEQSWSAFYQSDILLDANTTFRTGLRYDYLDATVNSDNARNSGNASDGLLSVSAGLSYLFTPSLEGYINAGQSFHSNDARGATISVDPISGDDADKVDLLVRGETAELGIRYFDSRKMNLSATLWALQLDSELLYVGDAGSTEPGRASTRYGVELSGYFWWDKLSADIEIALSHSAFEAGDETGRHIPGAVDRVIALGGQYQFSDNLSANVRLRHIGPRMLTETGDVQSGSLSVVNAGVRWRQQGWTLDLSVLNALNSRDHDIDYFYASRVVNEANEVEDVHFHPIEPRTLRFSVAYHF